MRPWKTTAYTYEGELHASSYSVPRSYCKRRGSSTAMNEPSGLSFCERADAVEIEATGLFPPYARVFPWMHSDTRSFPAALLSLLSLLADPPSQAHHLLAQPHPRSPPASTNLPHGHPPLRFRSTPAPARARDPSQSRRRRPKTPPPRTPVPRASIRGPRLCLLPFPRAPLAAVLPSRARRARNLVYHGRAESSPHSCAIRPDAPRGVLRSGVAPLLAGGRPDGGACAAALGVGRSGAAAGAWRPGTLSGGLLYARRGAMSCRPCVVRRAGSAVAPQGCASAALDSVEAAVVWPSESSGLQSRLAFRPQASGLGRGCSVAFGRFLHACGV